MTWEPEDMQEIVDKLPEAVRDLYNAEMLAEAVNYMEQKTSLKFNKDDTGNVEVLLAAASNLAGFMHYAGAVHSGVFIQGVPDGGKGEYAAEAANALRNQAQDLMCRAELLEIETPVDTHTDFDTEIDDLVSDLEDARLEECSRIETSDDWEGPGLTEDMILRVKNLCYRGRDQPPGVPLCPGCGIPLENDNVDMMQWFCPNGFGCKYVKKIADKSSIIDGIIDQFIKYVQPAEWYIPDWDKEVIALVLFNGQFKSDYMEKIRKINNITTLEWDCSSCYMWVDTKNIKKPIYRNSHCNEPINSRWKLQRTVEAHLYFIIEEVGVPHKWTRKIRPVKSYATIRRRTR